MNAIELAVKAVEKQNEIERAFERELLPEIKEYINPQLEYAARFGRRWCQIDLRIGRYNRYTSYIIKYYTKEGFEVKCDDGYHMTIRF